jgi:hypothetical protein
MHIVRITLLIAIITLVGCDRITGAANQKILDSEAIGYACRVSLKSPEECMKENEAQSPTSILTGWKEADKDIQGQLLDPSMGKATATSTTAHSAPAATETANKAATEKAAPVAAKHGEAETHKPAAH